MFGWLKELLELRIDYKTRKIQLESVKFDIQKVTADAELEHNRDLTTCQSCETLKMQLAIANQEKKDLLNRILTPPIQAKPEVIIQNPRAVIPPRHNIFATKRRELELASKENRRLLDEKAREESKVVLKPEDIDHTEISDLEEELDLAAANREAQSGVK